MNGLESATVIGLGLIGGSLARDLRRHGVLVRGWDADPDTVEAARREGIIEALPGDLHGAETADLVVLAVPVRSAPAILARLTPRLGGGTLVTDVGSTKRAIVCAARQLGLGSRFIGSHPITGDHRSGWSASRLALFEGSTVILTPTADTPTVVQERIAGLWTALGARIRIMDAEAHDRQMAWISHLPQAISSALALALADAGIAHRELGPGGVGATRLAGSSAAMWADIFHENADDVVGALRAAMSRIGSLTAAVERGDLAEVRRMLEDAAGWTAADGRDGLGN